MDLNTFDYDNAPVRTILIEDEPYFIARDVAGVLGYKWKGSSTVKHVPEDWKKICRLETSSGIQEVAALSEQGLYFFLNRSDKPLALPFQMWVNGQVLPALRKQTLSLEPPKVESAPVPAMSSLQLLQATVNAMVDQEQRLASVEQKLEDYEEGRKNALKALSQLPEPSMEVPDPSLRVLVSRVVREYAKANGIRDYSTLWNRLYMEFRDAFHVDLKIIAENRGISVLDLAEEREYLDKLYALAVKLFKHRAMSPTGAITWSDTWAHGEDS